MKKKVSKKVKRRMMISICAFSVLACTFVYSIFNDWMQIANNKKQLNQLTSLYGELLSEEESLASEVTKLQDEEYVARYAREKYMYSLPNEIIIKVPENKK